MRIHYYWTLFVALALARDNLEFVQSKVGLNLSVGIAELSAISDHDLSDEVGETYPIGHHQRHQNHHHQRLQRRRYRASLSLRKSKGRFHHQHKLSFKEFSESSVSADLASIRNFGLQYLLNFDTTELTTDIPTDLTVEDYSQLFQHLMHLNASLARGHTLPTLHRNRKPVVWMHLHNFAGTFMCAEAKSHGEVVPPGGSILNCNVKRDDCSGTEGMSSGTKRLGKYRTHRSGCAERAASDFTFSMMERDVDDADFCDNAMVATILRDPVAAAKSTIQANNFSKDDVVEVLASGILKPLNHTGCLPKSDTYQHFDNFATRSLGGGYDAPLGEVTREHLELAKERLQRMEVVIILEELDLHLPQLSTVFGWELDFKPPHQIRNRHDGNLDFTEADLQVFYDASRLDYELYEFGKELAADLTSAANRLGTLRSSMMREGTCDEYEWCPEEQDQCAHSSSLRRSCPCTCVAVASDAE